MNIHSVDLLRAFVWSLAAGTFFTIGFLVSKEAFLANVPPFNWLYSASWHPVLKTMLIGATFSAAGMVCAGYGFDFDVSVAAPTVAIAGLLGNIFAGMYLGQTPLSIKVVALCMVLVIVTAILIDALRNSPGA